MPSNFDYLHQTRIHLLELYERMLMPEEGAHARRPPATAELLLAGLARMQMDGITRQQLIGASRHRAIVVAPKTSRPVAAASSDVLQILRHFAAMEPGAARRLIRSDGERSFELLRLPPSGLRKLRFPDFKAKWEAFAAALWIGRHAFEWVHERATEDLLNFKMNFREMTEDAARFGTRYGQRDGFTECAFLPRDSRLLRSISDPTD